MSGEATEEDDARVEALLDEALAGMTEGVSAAAVAEIRALLAAELVATTHGQRIVRSASPDPTVSASAEVGTEPGEPETGKGSGGRAAG